MAALLDLDTVEVLGGPEVLASDADVDDLESRLGVRFPDGYREYVTRLGEGDLDALIRVFPPWRVLAELDAHRGMMAGFWSWEAKGASFSQDDAMESIPLADTIDGDMLVFHPEDRTKIIILPRHDEHLVVRGPDLLEAIDWICSGGTGSTEGGGRTFRPFDSRVQGDVTAGVEPAVADRKPATGGEAPYLDRPPREVLLAYFAELAARGGLGDRTGRWSRGVHGRRPTGSGWGGRRRRAHRAV